MESMTLREKVTKIRDLKESILNLRLPLFSIDRTLQNACWHLDAIISNNVYKGIDGEDIFRLAVLNALGRVLVTNNKEFKTHAKEDSEIKNQALNEIKDLIFSIEIKNLKEAVPDIVFSEYFNDCVFLESANIRTIAQISEDKVLVSTSVVAEEDIAKLALESTDLYSVSLDLPTSFEELFNVMRVVSEVSSKNLTTIKANLDNTAAKFVEDLYLKLKVKPEIAKFLINVALEED